MNINTNQLLNIIIKIISSDYKQEEIKELFHCCKSLSHAYLVNKYNQHKIFIKTIVPGSNFLDDFATDAVSTLFSRDSENKFHVFIKYFSPHINVIEKESALTLVLLRKLVVSKTKQEIIEFYKEENPSGWKIYRNVKEAPNRNTNIGVYNDFNKVFYYLFEDKSYKFPEDYSPNLLDIDEEIIRNWISIIIKETNKTPTIIEYVLRKLFYQMNFKKYLSRDCLFQNIKAEMGIIISPLNEEFLLIPNNIKMNNNILNKTQLFHFLESMISEKYLSKNKISQQESDLYKNISRDYFLDLINDGYTEKLTYYLNNQKKYQIISINDATHKSRIEYIIKLGRNYLKECVMEE